MKQWIPALLLLFLAAGCQKNFADKQELEEPVKIDNVVSSNEEEDIFCIYPLPLEAEFPGGTTAWLQFLQQHLTYPATAVDANIQGTVVVQFIINTDGKVSDIETVSGPAELRQSAIDVIKQSPNWTPMMQNGRNFKSYKKQPIVFRLEKE